MTVYTAADGTISALKVVAAGQTSIIPVDANGKPYMIDPNSKYEIKVTAYAQYMGQYAQSFYGGGAVSANSATYTQYDNIWNGANNILFPGTDINVEAGITSNYALYKTDSFMYTETGGNYYVSEADAKAGTSKKRVPYYTDTTKMPKYSGTLSFTTLDYTEDSMTVTGKNVTANSPSNNITVTGTHRSDESVKKELTYGTYFSIQLGAGVATHWISNGDGTATKAGDTMQQTVYIDSITITKKSQTASVSFDANGGSFSDGSAALAAETQYVGTALAPSPEQLRWLAGVLETAEGDIAMFCHQGIDAATKGPDMDVLKNLLGAFQNKTAYKNEVYGIDVDFSNGPSGHIVSYHAGHDHIDMTYYTPGANIWQMLSTTAEVYDIVSATDKLIIKNNSKYEDYDAKLIYPDLP